MKRTYQNCCWNRYYMSLYGTVMKRTYRNLQINLKLYSCYVEFNGTSELVSVLYESKWN